MRYIKIIIFIFLLVSLGSCLKVPGEPRLPSQEIYNLVDTKDDDSFDHKQETQIEGPDEDNDETDDESRSTSNNGLKPMDLQRSSSASDIVTIRRDISEILYDNNSRRNYIVENELICNSNINSLVITEIFDDDLILKNTPAYAYKIGSFEDACEYISNELTGYFSDFDKLYKNKYNIEYDTKNILFTWEKIDDVYEYVFSWKKIPGTDDIRLREFLSRTYDIDWVKNAKIIKSKDDKIITLSNKDKNLSLTLNNDKSNIALKIGNIRINDFAAKIENDELNVYVYNKEFISLYNYIVNTLALPWDNKKCMKIMRSDKDIYIYYNESVLLNKSKLFYKNSRVGSINKYGLLCNGSKCELNGSNVRADKDPDIDIFLKSLQNNLGLKIADRNLLEMVRIGDLIFFNFSDNIVISKVNINRVAITTKRGAKYSLLSEKEIDIFDHGKVWTNIYKNLNVFNIKIATIYNGQIIKYSYIVEPKYHDRYKLATVMEINDNIFNKNICELNDIDPSYKLNISIDTKNSKVHKSDIMNVEYSIKNEQSIPIKIKIDFEKDGKYFEYIDDYIFPTEEIIRNEPLIYSRKLFYPEEGEYAFPWIKVNGAIYDFKERKVNVDDLFPQVIQAFIALIMLSGIILGNIYGPLIRKKTKTYIEPYLNVIVTIIFVFIFILLYIIIERFR